MLGWGEAGEKNVCSKHWLGR